MQKIKAENISKENSSKKANMPIGHAHLDPVKIKAPNNSRGMFTNKNWGLIADENSGFKASNFFKSMNKMV